MRRAVRGLISRLEIARRWMTWREIRRLRRESDLVALFLAQAIEETGARQLSSEERDWIERIESLRRELEADRSEISYFDYGAGAALQQRTEQQMAAGAIRSVQIAEVCRIGSKSPLWCLLLFKLVRSLRPAVCLELGTCLGLSTAYQAAALKLNRTGQIVSLEGSDSLAGRAQAHFVRLGFNNARVVRGRFQDTLDQVLAADGPFDFAFIDGHHDEKATLGYFEAILGSAAPSATLVFDDISWSPGMARAWRQIAADRRVQLALNLSQVGICAIGETARKRSFDLELA